MGVLIRRAFGFLLLSWLLSGCAFEPGVRHLGYAECGEGLDACPTDFVCLEGVCVPDCAALEEKAGFSPDADAACTEPGQSGGDLEDTACWTCSIGRDCTFVKDDETGLHRLAVELRPDRFLFLRSNQAPACEGRMVARFSMMAQDATGEGKKASFSIWETDRSGGFKPGPDAATFELHQAPLTEDGFREKTHFLIMRKEHFSWPELRFEAPEPAKVWIRNFRLSCCN